MRISDWSSDVCSSDLVVKNTIKDFSEQNAYLRNFYGLSNTREKYKAFGGIRGSFSSSVGFKAQFEYANEIGRASCRERVCQYVEISEVAVSLTKHNYANATLTISHTTT